jgi:hypothetical protein
MKDAEEQLLCNVKIEVPGNSNLANDNMLHDNMQKGKNMQFISFEEQLTGPNSVEVLTHSRFYKHEKEQFQRRPQ